jgi:hypothetical protein
MLQLLRQVGGRLVLVALATLVMSGCANEEREKTAEGEAPHYSLIEVEEALTNASVAFVREKSGPLRVGTREPPYCEELHSPDSRMTVTVCRDADADIMLLRVLPRKDAVGTFENTTSMLAYLSGGQRLGQPTPLLVVDEANLTVTYLGSDASRVRALADALRSLKED